MPGLHRVENSLKKGWGLSILIYLSTVLFFSGSKLVKKPRKSCKIIDIQSFSSQLCETIIDYLILATVTPKQCPGVFLIGK